MSLQPHIQLSKEMTGARYALLPGDPQRVDRIVNFLDNPQLLGQNREFRAARLVSGHRDFGALHRHRRTLHGDRH
jgi:uridine phosphorylase